MNFLSCTLYCLLSINMKIDSGLAKIMTSKSLSFRTRVVLFDIDTTLLTTELLSEELKNIQRSHPECPIVSFTDEEDKFQTKNSYAFLPHLKILFDYLIDAGARIVFFSGDMQKKNQAIITELLASFWDKEELEVFKELGQFDVFSGKDLFRGNFSDLGYRTQDLKRIIRKDELLSDVILVEDDQTFTAYDQEPVKHIEELLLWFIKKTQEEVVTQLARRRFRDFPLNSVYFMHGVFKTYFEHEKCDFTPYRPILPGKKDHKEVVEKNPFAYSMIDRGLAEVQKFVPDAKFYGSKYHGTFSYSFTFPVLSSTASV